MNLKFHVPGAFLCLHALGNVGGGQGALIPCVRARVCRQLPRGGRPFGSGRQLPPQLTVGRRPLGGGGGAGVVGVLGPAESPPPWQLYVLSASHALVQATVGVGTVIIHTVTGRLTTNVSITLCSWQM